MNTFGLSEVEAKRLVSNLPTDDMVRALKTAVRGITDKNARLKAEAVISSPAYAYRMDRLKALSDNTRNACNAIYKAEIKQDRAFFKKEIDKAYKHSIFDIQNGTGVYSAFDVMPQSRINRILSTNWSGKHFSERVWGNTNELAAGLTHDMLVGIMSGKSEKHLAEDIMSRMAKGEYVARRLVRTETTYISNAAELDGYKQLDIKKYEFSACIDKRTSDKCRELNGQIFEVSKAKAGTNLPPMHPFCRSTTKPVLPSAEELDKKADSLEKELSGDMDFTIWLEGLEEKDGKLCYRGVDKSGKSDIIEVEKNIQTKDNEMFRKPHTDIIEPMPKKQFRRIEKSFKAKGGRFIYGDDIDEYLKARNVEAITYNHETIFLMQHASRASVFEELIHASQYKRGENDGTYLSRLKCEIKAQKMLIKNAKAYKLTTAEINQTKKALKDYEKELENYLKNGGV